MSGKNDYEKNKTYWLRRAGLLPPEPEPVVESPRAPSQAPPHERADVVVPVCVVCGGTPQLGVSKPGGVQSYCRECADKEYLEKLTPEERALLRR